MNYGMSAESLTLINLIKISSLICSLLLTLSIYQRADGEADFNQIGFLIAYGISVRGCGHCYNRYLIF